MVKNTSNSSHIVLQYLLIFEVITFRVRVDGFVDEKPLRANLEEGTQFASFRKN